VARRSPPCTTVGTTVLLCRQTSRSSPSFFVIATIWRCDHCLYSATICKTTIAGLRHLNPYLVSADITLRRLTEKRFLLCDLVRLAACCIAIFCLVGCGEPTPAAFKLNSVELLKQEKLFLSGGQSFDEKYSDEIGTILTAFFGTPDKPRVPKVLPEEDPASEVMSQENLDIGPKYAELRRSSWHRPLPRTLRTLPRNHRRWNRTNSTQLESVSSWFSIG